MQQNIYQNPGASLLLISQSLIGGYQWANNTSYTVGQIVSSGVAWFLCNTSHVSPISGTFSGSGDSVNFTQVMVANFTPSGIAHGTGWQSLMFDRALGVPGAPLPSHYRWRARTKWSWSSGTYTTVIGEQNQLYLITSDGSNVDGLLGATNAAISSALQVSQLQSNCQQFGSVKENTAYSGTGPTTTQELSSGDLFISERFISIAMFNGSASAPLSTDGSTTDHFVILTPYPDAIQTLA